MRHRLTRYGHSFIIKSIPKGGFDMAIFDQDFFDTLTDKLAATGKAISEKAKEVTDSAKLSLQIAQEEKNLRAAYRKLGEYIYEKSGIETDGASAPYFAAITEVKQKLEQLKKVQEKAPEYSEDDCDCDEQDCDCDCECDDCDCEDDCDGSAEAEAEAFATEQVCAGCKSVVSAQLIYCPKCGNKLK